MGSVAVITGGGQGIGRAVALRLAVDGWSVVVAGRTAASLNAVVDQIVDRGGKALAVVADVTQPPEVDQLFEQVGVSFGRLDLLFNNAGITAPPVPIDELSLDDWNSVVATNLTGSFLCARAAFKRMRDQDPQGGRIINNGSISSMAPRPFSAPYTATKHAITGLTKALALDGRAINVAVGQIDIGNAASSMVDSMAAGTLQADGSVRSEPLMPVEQVADAVAHMASLPLDSNVLSMTIMATAMPFVGRG